MASPICAHRCEFTEKGHAAHPEKFDHDFVPEVSPLRKERDELRDMAEAHAEGWHGAFRREFCPECKR